MLHHAVAVGAKVTVLPAAGAAAVVEGVSGDALAAATAAVLTALVTAGGYVLVAVMGRRTAPPDRLPDEDDGRPVMVSIPLEEWEEKTAKAALHDADTEREAERQRQAEERRRRRADE